MPFFTVRHQSWMRSAVCIIAMVIFFADNDGYLPGMGVCFGQAQGVEDGGRQASELTQPSGLTGKARLARTVENLLETIANSGFEQRERAAASLMRLGPAAIGPLQEIGSDHSREVRDRAALVLKEIERQHLIETSRVFLTDTDPTQSHGLPAWRFFQQHIGGSRVSKQLYLELLKAQYHLAELIETADHAMSVQHAEDIDRSQRILREALRDQAVNLWPMMFRGSGVGVGDSAALLLGVMVLDQPIPAEVSQLIHSSVQLGFFGYLNRSGYRNCLRSLLAGWIPKAQESMAPEVMRIAYDLDIDAALPIALKHLSKTFDKTTREHAIFCVAKFGSTSNVPDLLTLHSDTTVVYEFDDTAGGIIVSRAAPPGLPFQGLAENPHKLLRINDLAIAAAMILLDEDPQSIFPRFSKDLFFNRSLTSLAIDEESAEFRTAQLKAWALDRLNNSYDG